MKKIILLVFLAIGLFSCSSHLDKSVLEPLTVNELKKSIDNDSIFKNLYKSISYIRDSVLKTEIDKVKFTDLTYRQVYDLEKFLSDTTYSKQVNERIKKEWNEKYGIYKEKVDSVSNYWKKYKEENSLEQYVNIELVKIDKEYYSYSGDIKDVNLGFKLTPLKGKIDQIRFGYRIEAKINESKKRRVSLDSWCFTTTPFSNPTIRYWEANYSNEKILKYETIDTFNRDYNIYIEIDQIRKDGKNMSNDDLNIPKSVSDYWEYGDSDFSNSFLVDKITKELFNKNYLSEFEYYMQETEKIAKEKDPLAFEFLDLEYKSLK